LSIYKYLLKRILLYVIVFYIAISLIWILVRFAPGDPALTSYIRIITPIGISISPEQLEALKKKAIVELGYDKPIQIQYIIYLYRVFTGDLGISIYFASPVSDKLRELIINDLILIGPAIISSWFLGNYIGAFAARNKNIDRILVPMIYILTATPYFLFGLVMVYFIGIEANQYFGNFFKPVLSQTDIRSFLTSPSYTTFIEFMRAYTLPFLSMVLVSTGGWASGMRSLMIYELESNYARYMESIGFSDNKISSYAFRYAINPQITGLGIQLGTLIVAGLALSSVFNYPGTGIALIYAINFRDVFLIQGIAIYYTLMVIIFNFIIDILYIIIDPRIRYGFIGG